MSSGLIKRSRSRCSIFSKNPRNKIIELCSTQILHDSSIPDRKENILDYGLVSSLFNLMRNPSGSHQNLTGSSSVGSKFGTFSHVNPKPTVLASGRCGLSGDVSGVRFLSSGAAAVEPSTSDGLTVDRINASGWTILDESESDWKSHAAAICQSIQVIKRRLQWKRLMVRLNILSVELNKPDLWNDPVHAGKISREHGSLMGRIKEVKAFEQELLEHIDMIKLAREENDTDLESESLEALLTMRRLSKEKELEALLSGEKDSCSCYIEVQSGAGGTESNDWALMVMQMYKSWAQRRGFAVTVVDEMPGEIAGIKVHFPKPF